MDQTEEDGGSACEENIKAVLYERVVAVISMSGTGRKLTIESLVFGGTDRKEQNSRER